MNKTYLSKRELKSDNAFVTVFMDTDVCISMMGNLHFFVDFKDRPLDFL